MLPCWRINNLWWNITCQPSPILSFPVQIPTPFLPTSHSHLMVFSITRTKIQATNPSHPLYSSLLKSTGLLALKSNGYNATDGPFIFPDCGFGIDFKPNTMVLAIFAQRSYIHGTLPPNKPGDLIKVGLSMQIAQKTTKICDRLSMHVGDVPHILNKIKK
ncbi:hypothetical protein PSHT_06524 [Puccinia striiformis]|uniref:Tet-like 2OG-Fe(II) oxygenase domain-containing protein n=1 Tax=Puccinia striiformis TaxID=27350 RepID=A0A2S4W5Z7_9BASI|nr:hypothetical protein PSHT_06524 [Puccinia striiformis]